MTDVADVASDLQDLQIKVALERQREDAKKHEAVLQTASGHCLNCEEPLETGRFCDADCREDFERRIKPR